MEYLIAWFTNSQTTQILKQQPNSQLITKSSKTFKVIEIIMSNLWCISTIFFNRTQSCVFFVILSFRWWNTGIFFIVNKLFIGLVSHMFDEEMLQKNPGFLTSNARHFFPFIGFLPTGIVLRGEVEWVGGGERSLWRSLEEVRLFLFHRIVSHKWRPTSFK